MLGYPFACALESRQKLIAAAQSTLLVYLKYDVVN